MQKTDKKEEGRLERAVTTTLGAGMTLYGLLALSRVPAALRSGWMGSMRVTGRLAWIFTIGSPWRDWILLGTGWVAWVALVIGGICVILRRKWGMRAAVAGLAINLVLAVLGIPLGFSLAMGWVALDSSNPAFSRFAQSPPALQRLIWWWSMIPTLLGILVAGGALLWLRRALAAMRSPDGQDVSG